MLSYDLLARHARNMGRSYTSRNSNSKAVHTHHEQTLPHHEDLIFIFNEHLPPNVRAWLSGVPIQWTPSLFELNEPTHPYQKSSPAPDPVAKHCEESILNCSSPKPNLLASSWFQFSAIYYVVVTLVHIHVTICTKTDL